MSIASERVLDALRDHGCDVREVGSNQWRTRCPVHNGQSNDSLHVTSIEESVLLCCHAGCDNADVLAAIELSMRDLFDNPGGKTSYTYGDGRVVWRTVEKKFWQEVPKGGNTKGTALFHAERIGDAPLVFVAEGEKDVLAIETVGGTAVCSAMGAGKAHMADWRPLGGKHVIIVADDDEPGRKHAADVNRQLIGIAASVSIVQAAVGKDAADHIAAGKSLGEFVSVSGPPPVATGADDKPKLWRAPDLKPAGQQRWLAKGRLVRAAINLLIGDEGIGKSLLWVWIVAAVTTGKALPAFGIPARDPGHVIIVVTEDDWATVVRPRLDVAGADLSMISVICIEDDGSGSPTFPNDLHLIADADPVPVMVVVDAWLDTVPAQLSVRDPQHARQALHPWREVATAIDAAVLLLCHTNRVASASARDRYGATGELRKKARMTLYAQSDDEGRLVVGPEKMNTAAPIPASMFTVKAVQHFDPSDDDDGTVPELIYAGESDRTAREHIADAYDSDHGEDRQERVDAERWLSDYLNEQGPRADSAVAKREAVKAGITEKVLRSARVRLGVVIGYEGMPAKSVWSLPEQVADDGDDAPARRALGTVSDGPRAQQAEVDPSPQVNVDVPSHAQGHNRAQQSPPADIREDPPVVPLMTDTQGQRARQAPGAPTERTPGMTDRVQQIVAKANARNRHPANHGQFIADPPCFHCDKPVVSSNRDERGRYVHHECQRQAAEVAS